MSAWRLARAQAGWAPAPLVAAACSLAVAAAVLLLAAAFGRGLQRAGDAYLGAHLPTNVFDVVAAATKFDQALWGDVGGPGEGALDAGAHGALAALTGVRAAEAVLDLPLPLMAEGGAALLGRDLRADLLVTGLSPRLAVAPPDGPAFVAPFVDNNDGPVPVLAHPRLLATYNAAVARSLGTPQLQPEALLGLRFYVRVGASHLPGRAAVRRAGGFAAQLVGLSEAATPLGLSLPEASAARLWASYAAPSGPPPLARVRIEACRDDDVPRLQARVRRLGLEVDDAAGGARAAVAMARRITQAAGAAMALLVLGYGALALAGHFAGSAAAFALMGSLGHTRRTVLAACALQGAAVGTAGGAAGAAGAWPAARLLQAGLQRAADIWGLQLPELFVPDARQTLTIVAILAATAACGGVWAAWPRLDKMPGTR